MIFMDFKNSPYVNMHPLVSRYLLNPGGIKHE
jgi:hypothetical protein